ncbi:uncharacterized protein PITG_15758 [Phytophthora infestans T30-4]|uniref:Uncharacterized protein n=1 Tax=Phytophthora infestans (strain T30-4) TaxID=403677 RepID=D0NSH2_PHYIT|nr:uncharacterized protein PITG_15758 [Phytophthora infestans T30-4]EEY64517.1 conserved hypothetical protein [Phytophthora infestans T30-4]|eukprot:XP_002898020.1 conserved hypothetical protein [Phytophthora infestans T30-4]
MPKQFSAVKGSDHVYYGQVVEAEGDQLSILSDGQQLTAEWKAVSVVAPIVALLLEHIQFDSDEWSAREIEAVENTVLDRVLGQDIVGSNQIPDILEGLIAEANYPSATKVCKWTDPSTGQQTEFSLQHALDFAYYVDGGVKPVPPTVGQAFCCPPQSQSPIGGGDGEEREGSELFDPFIDDDDTPQDQSEPIREGTVQVTTRPERPKRSRQPVSSSDDGVHEAKRRRTAVDQDALIVEKLSDDPELLERFLAIRQANRQSQTVPRTQVSTSSKMIGQPPPRKRVTVASKYAFAPRDDQQEVHERVTSEKHKEDERMSWLESGGSNFGNLSATAEFAAATPASRIEDALKFVAAAGNRPEKQQKWVCSRLSSDATQVNGVLSNDRFTAVDVSHMTASDKVVSSLRPKRTASVNAVSENKQCKIGKTMVSAKSKGDRKIKHALEEELLADEARISITHRGVGFVRAKQLEISPYEIDNVAQVGIDVQWRQGPMKNRPPPKNHGSCRRYLRAVTRSIREGQDSGQYMVVEADILDRWPEIICSPLGAVVKKGVDPNEEVRTIHYLSFPKNDSWNPTQVIGYS